MDAESYSTHELANTVKFLTILITVDAPALWVKLIPTCQGRAGKSLVAPMW